MSQPLLAAADEVILLHRRKVDKARAVTCHTHQQVRILLGVRPRRSRRRALRSLEHAGPRCEGQK
ncbi:MAG: hypothetical protein ACYCZF_16285 [Anaerolineae bacterium]